MILNYLLVFFSLVHFFAVILFFLGLFKKVDGESHSQPFVTVIIALKNEEENLHDLLRGLKDQDYPGNKHEILLVDNDSADNTFAKLQQLTAKLDNFHCLSTKNYQSEYRYKKEALMMGIENSRGDIILSTDADCVIPATWISAMVRNYTEDVEMVIGFSEVIANSSVFQKLQTLDFMQLMAAAKGSLNLGFPWGGSGQNISFRKQAFYNCEGYKNLKTIKGGDDTLFIQKFAKKNEGRIVFADNHGSGVKTKAVESFRAFMRQRIRWASEANYTRHFNLLVFFISLGTFLANFSILYYLIMSFINSSYWPYFLGLTALKFLGEFALALKAAKSFGLKRVLPFFPLWFVIYPAYAFFLGIMSFQGQKVKWK
ncbi:MAG: glycosyltransferase [Fidelibacterota bacterium]